MARVVRYALLTAIAAALDMTAESSGAASFDRERGPPLRRRQRRVMLITESRFEVAEHIRHFDPFARHEQAVRCDGPGRLDRFREE